MKVHRQTGSIRGEKLLLGCWRRLVGFYLEDWHHEGYSDLGWPSVYHFHEARGQLCARQQLDVRYEDARGIRRHSRDVTSDIDRIRHAPLSPLGLSLPPLEIGGCAIALDAARDRAQGGRSTGRKHQMDGNLRDKIECYTELRINREEEREIRYSIVIESGCTLTKVICTIYLTVTMER